MNIKDTIMFLALCVMVQLCSAGVVSVTNEDTYIIKQFCFVNIFTLRTRSLSCHVNACWYCTAKNTSLLLAVWIIPRLVMKRR